MLFRSTIIASLLACSSLLSASHAQAPVVVLGAPVGGTSVVVGRPVLPAPLPAPVVVNPTYSVGYGAPYSVGYGNTVGYSSVGYGTVLPSTYVAPSPVLSTPVVSYRPYVATTYVSPYVVGRPAIVTPNVYYPGQPVRNVIRAFTPY